MIAEEAKRTNLGRGLSSLLGDDSSDYAELDKLRSTKEVPIEHLHPGRYQPRHSMNDEHIRELAQSIAEKGVLQPLLVRRHPDIANEYEIVAGERRWRAAQQARVHQVPVVIKDLDDKETLEIALVENLQRQDLSPLDEARGYARLTEEFSHTQEDLAKVMGKSRSHVANMMRLLNLPDAVKAMLERGDLSAGHARALLNAPNPLELALQVVKRGLNVRQTERLTQEGVSGKAAPGGSGKDADTLALERDLSNSLGMKVEIRDHKGKGSLVVNYKSLEQLDDLLLRLSGGKKGSGA
ncbi:MAG: ParB/RepB/Spo0J family partition protein [Rhodospirillales bacterium]|nr:ParB/RepB/Spo0J family partition protein [Rhodospirillales bacterium]